MNETLSPLLNESSDCLWLLLENKRDTPVFGSRFLRDLDWKTRGLISRVVTEKGKGSKQTIFVSVANKLPHALCAIDTLESFNAKRFEENVSGLKAKKLILVYENAHVKKSVESKMTANEMKRLAPQSIFFEDEP